MTAAELASKGRSGAPPCSRVNRRSRSACRRVSARACSRRTVRSLRFGGRLAMARSLRLAQTRSDSIEQVAQAADDYVESLGVLPAFRYYEMSMLLARRNMQKVHGPHALVILVLERAQIATAVHDVTPDTAHQPNVVVRVDE